MRRALLLATLVCGCSFPDPEISAEAVDSNVDSSVAEASADAEADSSLDETMTDATNDGGEVSTDARTDGDASDAKSDVIPCETGDFCDCDGDGDKKPGAGCGGSDCDDGDKRRNSKVSTFQDYSPAGTGHAGDWNCNTVLEREFGNGGVNCGGLALGPCAGTQGYKETNPACGGTATYVTCKVSAGLFCAEDTATTGFRVKCK